MAGSPGAQQIKPPGANVNDECKYLHTQNILLIFIHFDLKTLRCRAARRPDSWSAQKVKNFEIIVGPGPGTLKKPKYHYMVVWGLLVQELETLKDLKAEKGWFFGQN